MKTIITALAIGISAFTAGAHGGKSAFNLKMHDNGVFSVYIDNAISAQQTTMFSLSSIRPGNHKMKVVRWSYLPYQPFPVQQVVFKGWISIPPKSVVYAQINCHSLYDVVKVEPYFCPPAYGSHCNNYDCDEDDDWGYYGTGNGWGPPPPPPPVCMCHEDFMRLKGSIESKAFESSRLQIAKQAMGSGYFTSAQVAELVKMMTFESSKLELARHAYTRTTDKQNYYLVNDAFTFESSISDLTKFIASAK